jgi:riboflavin kinase/FMN adenylyltransferase
VRHYRSLEPLDRDGRPIYLAIGSFDGVHRGHAAVLQALLRAARRDGASAVVLTFSPHPLAVLRPEGAPPTLTTSAQRVRLLEAMGLDALVELPFDEELAAVPAGAFVAEYLCRRARARRAFVGADFTFGAGGAGTAAMLATLGREACGLETEIIPLVWLDGAPVSSTRIRQALRDGRPALAARLLGRPYSVLGPVVAGERRGRDLGFPTANVDVPTGTALPAPGVYATRVCLRAAAAPGCWNGVANLGLRPTFDGTSLRLEVHLLDFDGDLYGAEVEVAFIRRLRGERRFRDVGALRRQIGRDIARARMLLAASAGRGPAAPVGDGAAGR